MLFSLRESDGAGKRATGREDVMPKRVCVYIDGFNLYRGCLKDTPHRWLDYRKLCRNILDDILKRDYLGDDLKGDYLNDVFEEGYILVSVEYFTSKFRDNKFEMQEYYKTIRNKERRERQNYYLRVLKTLRKNEEKFRIEYGHFNTTAKKMPKLNERNKIEGLVWVARTEEKRSDVNLAVHLVRDAYKDEFDLAVVISDDSDLSEAVRVVAEDIGRRVLIVSPACRRDALHCNKKRALSYVATHKRAYPILERHLENAWLPNPVINNKGKPRRTPQGWNQWQGNEEEARKKRVEKCLNGKCKKK